MSTAQSIVSVIDKFTDGCGRALGWLLLLMMVITCLVVILRYGFGIGLVGMQESVTYLHATVFMLGTAYAYQKGEHVRVDIFYRNFSARRKAWVDSLGILIFLLPFCGLIFFSSLGFVSNSWSIFEKSGEPGGIPAVFLLKTLIPLMAVFLALQGVAELIRNALVLAQEGEADD